MMQIGQYRFRPWLKGLALAPQCPAALALVRLHHRNQPAEIVEVRAVADLREALAEATRRGVLSNAIRREALPGCAIALASVACESLSEARAIAADVLSPKRKSEANPPNVSELVRQVRALHAAVTQESHRRTLRQVRDLLLKRLV